MVVNVNGYMNTLFFTLTSDVHPFNGDTAILVGYCIRGTAAPAARCWRPACYMLEVEL